jgi:SAM-dependent methyltransferase
MPSQRAAEAGRPKSHADQVRCLFDVKAATWPDRYAAGGPFAGRLNRFLAVLFQDVPPGGRVLDLGCGSGELARAVAAAGLRATACDISAMMLHSAAGQDPAGAVEWVRLDPHWQVLPFPGDVFDAVVAASVLEYVEEPVAVLGECARVLRPGGLIACTVPDPRHPIRWLESLGAMAARTRIGSAASRRSASLEARLTYLRTSRQRHTAGWWLAAAERAGLLPVPCPPEAEDRSPLRLQLFRRPPGEPRQPADRGGRS